MRLYGAIDRHRIVHYSNTTERTFKIASELVRTGVKPAKTAEAIFGSYHWPKIELLSQVLGTAQRDESGHVALDAPDAPRCRN